MFIIEILTLRGVLALPATKTITVQGKEQTKIITAIFEQKEMAEEYVVKHREELKKSGVLGYIIKEYTPI